MMSVALEELSGVIAWLLDEIASIEELEAMLLEEAGALEELAGALLEETVICSSSFGT